MSCTSKLSTVHPQITVFINLGLLTVHNTGKPLITFASIALTVIADNYLKVHSTMMPSCTCVVDSLIVLHTVCTVKFHPLVPISKQKYQGHLKGSKWEGFLLLVIVL